MAAPRQPLSTGGDVVRVLPGADVWVVLDAVSVGVRSAPTELEIVTRTVTSWAGEPDFFAAAVLTDIENPGAMLVYAQRLPAADGLPSEVPERWLLPFDLGTRDRWAELYLTTLVRQQSAGSAPMQHLRRGAGVVSVGRFGSQGPSSPLEERELARRQLADGGLASISFHGRPGAGCAVEVAVWDDTTAFDNARRDSACGDNVADRVVLFGPRYRVHEVVTRAPTGARRG